MFFCCQLLSLYFNFGVSPYVHQRYIGDMSLDMLSVALAYNNSDIFLFIVIALLVRYDYHSTANLGCFCL